MDDELIGRQSAIAEARGLYRLLSTGSTVEELKALIAVPPKLECVLRAYAQAESTLQASSRSDMMKTQLQPGAPARATSR